MTAPRKKRRGIGSRPGRSLNAWQRSARFREVALAALRKINGRRHLLKKCSATSKSTGQQCGNLPVHGQTKCRFHGGVTGRADAWHQPRWPKPSDPRAMQKIHAKLTARAKNQKERDARLASLSPRLREKYGEWVRAHRPGPAAARRREKERRRQDAEARASFAAVMNRPATPPSPELQAITARIEELKALLANAEAGNESPDGPGDETDDAAPGCDVKLNSGVFA